MDPLGNLPVLMSVLEHTELKKRRAIVVRELPITLLIMLVFLFVSEKVLVFLSPRVGAVSIPGGIILLLIIIKMAFPSTSGNSNRLPVGEEPFIVPLAIPLVVGPTTPATLMLLPYQHPNQTEHLVTALLLAWSGTFVILPQSSLFLRLLDGKGVNTLERLVGLTLVMMAAQMFLDGIRMWIKGQRGESFEKNPVASELPGKQI